MNKIKTVGYRSSAELFITPKFEKSYESVEDAISYPIGSFENGQPIEFKLAGNNVHCIPTNSVKLYLRLKLVKKDGTEIASGVQLGVVNNTLHSLFSSCEVSLNETKINNTSGYYAYSSYFKKLLRPNLSCNSFDSVLYEIDKKPSDTT